MKIKSKLEIEGKSIQELTTKTYSLKGKFV